MSLWPENPGIQVIISAYNAEPYIEKALRSVERALRGYKWILILGDDCSSDKTPEILANYKSLTADRVIFEKFGKALTVGQAKNRTIELGREFRADYPAICLMDADDIMGEDRVRHLLPFAVQNNHLVVVGDHMRLGEGFAEHEQLFPAKENAGYIGFFGPWTLIFHACLIPENGILFPENTTLFEDSLVYFRWISQGVRMVSHPGKIVHYYFQRNNTVSSYQDTEARNVGHSKWMDLKFELFHGKEIDLGLKIDLTFYSIFSEGENIENLVKFLARNIERLTEYPNIEFILLDQTVNKVAHTVLNYPFAKELACGTLKYIHVNKNSEEQVHQKLLEKGKGGKFCFMPCGFELNNFLIGDILAQKIESVLTYPNLIVVSRGTLEKKP